MKARYRRVLVLKTDHLGDAVLATPALTALRRLLPRARITVAVKGASRPVLEHHPDVDRLVTLDTPWTCHRGAPRLGLAGLWERVAWLRRLRPDATLSLQHDPRTHMVAYLTGARVRVGLTPRGGAWLLSRALPGPGPDEHVSHELLRVVEGLARRELPLPAPSLRVLPREAERARARLAGLLGTPLPPVLLHLGAGNPAKGLLVEQLVPLARGLAARAPGRVALLAGPGEESRLEAVLSGLERALPALPPLELRELMATLGAARLFVGHDSGPSHMAAALGTPTLALFGPSSPARWGPRGPRVRWLRRVVCEQPCGPDRPVEPCRCFRELEPDAILAEVDGLLASTERDFGIPDPGPKRG